MIGNVFEIEKAGFRQESPESIKDIRKGENQFTSVQCQDSISGRSAALGSSERFLSVDELGKMELPCLIIRKHVPCVDTKLRPP
jgi:hypothetical protein